MLSRISPAYAIAFIGAKAPRLSAAYSYKPPPSSDPTKEKYVEATPDPKDTPYDVAQSAYPSACKLPIEWLSHALAANRLSQVDAPLTDGNPQLPMNAQHPVLHPKWDHIQALPLVLRIPPSQHPKIYPKPDLRSRHGNMTSRDVNERRTYSPSALYIQIRTKSNS